MPKRRPNNEGSVGKKVQKDKRRRGYVSLPDGGRQWVSGRTMDEVKTKVAELQQQIDQGRPPTGAKTTVEEWVTGWIKRRLLLNKVRASTAVRYEEIARLHIFPRIGKIIVRKLRPADLDRLYDRLMTEPRPPKAVRQKRGRPAARPPDAETKLPPLSAETVRHAHRLLHVSLKDAERRGLTLRNPADLVDPPEVKRTGKREIDPAKTEALLTAAEGTRLKAMFWLAAGTGLRESELFGLVRADVNLDEAWVKVDKKARRVATFGIQHDAPKTESSERKLALPSLVVDVMREHFELQDAERSSYKPQWQALGLVFTNSAGGFLEAGTFREREWLPLLKTAGITEHVTFHEFTRHGHASVLEHLNVDRETRRQRLGHASAETTDRFYTHPISGADRDAAERWDQYMRRRLKAS